MKSIFRRLRRLGLGFGLGLGFSAFVLFWLGFDADIKPKSASYFGLLFRATDLRRLLPNRGQRALRRQRLLFSRRRRAFRRSATPTALTILILWTGFVVGSWSMFSVALDTTDSNGIDQPHDLAIGKLGVCSDDRLDLFIVLFA